MNEHPGSRSRATLVRAGMIITMSGPPVTDGAILIQDGRIESIDRYERLRRCLDPDRLVSEIGSPSHVAMPGMVDAHQHGRGMSQVQAGVRDGPLETLQFGRLASRVPDIDPYFDTLYSCRSLMESGVTTVVHGPIVRDPMGEDTLGELERVFQAYVDSGIRVLYCVAISDQNSFIYDSNQFFFDSLPDETKELGRRLSKRRQPVGSSDYFNFLTDVAARATEASEGRVRIGIGPMGPQWCSDQLLVEIRGHASDKGYLIHAHCLETVFQREYGHRVYGEGVIEHLARIGFLGPDVTLAHCVWVTEHEVEILAETDTHVAHNPSSNLRLRSGIAPLLALIRGGVNVGLGSDSLSWNDDHDFFQEIRAAFRLHRLAGLAGEELSATDVLRMATKAGAKLAGWESEVGQLNRGARADIVLLNSTDLGISTIDNGLLPEEHLVNRAKSSNVDTVLIDGEVVVEGGKSPLLNRDYVETELQRTNSRRIVRERADFIKEAAPFIEGYFSGWNVSLGDEPFYVFNAKK